MLHTAGHQLVVAQAHSLSGAQRYQASRTLSTQDTVRAYPPTEPSLIDQLGKCNVPGHCSCPDTKIARCLK